MQFKVGDRVKFKDKKGGDYFPGEGTIVDLNDFRVEVMRDDKQGGGGMRIEGQDAWLISGRFWEYLEKIRTNEWKGVPKCK